MYSQSTACNNLLDICKLLPENNSGVCHLFPANSHPWQRQGFMLVIEEPSHDHIINVATQTIDKQTMSEIVIHLNVNAVGQCTVQGDIDRYGMEI